MSSWCLIEALKDQFNKHSKFKLPRKNETRRISGRRERVEQIGPTVGITSVQTKLNLQGEEALVEVKTRRGSLTKVKDNTLTVRSMSIFLMNVGSRKIKRLIKNKSDS